MLIKFWYIAHITFLLSNLKAACKNVSLTWFQWGVGTQCVVLNTKQGFNTEYNQQQKQIFNYFSEQLTKIIIGFYVHVLGRFSCWSVHHLLEFCTVTYSDAWCLVVLCHQHCVSFYIVISTLLTYQMLHRIKLDRSVHFPMIMIEQGLLWNSLWLLSK